MCSEAALHWKKQIHLSRSNCLLITVNQAHRMIPFFISLYTYHVRHKNVATWLTPLKCLHPCNSYSKYVHFSWPYHRNLNIDNQRLVNIDRHTRVIICGPLISTESVPQEEHSSWHYIRSSETQSRYARLIPPQISHDWSRHAGTHWWLFLLFAQPYTEWHVQRKKWTFLKIFPIQDKWKADNDKWMVQHYSDSKKSGLEHWPR